MSAALATSELSLPDPPQDRLAASAAAPSRFGSVLGLIRMLIDYGKGLAGTVQQPTAATDIDLQVSFGTRNIALMLARITRGLMLLTALETRLIGLLGRRQHVRREATAPSVATREAPPRKPRGGQPAGAPPRLEDPESLLVRMPTEEEITAFVSRRPIGAVIASICSDLGITSVHPQWEELKDAVVSHGGSFIRFIRELFDRCSLTKHFPPDMPIPPSVLQAWASGEFAFGTGPP